MDKLERYDRAIRRQQEFGLSWEEAMHPYVDYPTGHREHFSLEYPLPSPLPDVVYAEASLTLEHERQAKKLAQRYAKRLGLSAEEYIGSLPSFPDMPRSRGTGARPLIIEGVRIPWRVQAALSGIDISSILDNLEVEDITTLNPPPQKPFTTWVSHFHSLWRDCEFELGSRRASIIEGIAYWNAYDYLVMGNLFWLHGSQITTNPEENIYLSGRATSPSIHSISEEDRMWHMPAAFSASFIILLTGRDIRT